MRIILWRLSIFFILTGLAVLSIFVVLAAVGPYHPGQAFYPLQDAVEQGVVVLNLFPTDQALQEMNVAERRIQDLGAAAGTPDEQAALQALEVSLEESLRRSASAPQKDAPLLKRRLIEVLDQADRSLGLLASAQGQPQTQIGLLRTAIEQLKAQLEIPNVTFTDLSGGGASGGETPMPVLTASPGALMTPGAIDPRMVLFPPGSPGAVHAFYPLTGKHASLQCVSCHTTGAYAGTATQCAVCHAQQKPAAHFPGDCAACHTTNGWLPASFDHAVAGATDCVSCHTKDAPANHFQGQCSACHSTSAWLPAHFDHKAAGATNCVSCHSKDAPANHFQGQCSACHSTSAWQPAHFDHKAAGATNCVSCHSKDRPANHFDGQCSNCHNTSSWADASFNHTFPTNHGGANGVCAKCHPSGTSTWTCFTCHNQAQLTAKHQDEGISDIATRCLACHPAGNGGDGGDGGGGGGGGDD
jgi:hypothetical protein